MKAYLKDKGGEGNMELIFCVVESITSAGTMHPGMPIDCAIRIGCERVIRGWRRRNGQDD